MTNLHKIVLQGFPTQQNPTDFVGHSGLLTVDITTGEIIFHDGVTPGGISTTTDFKKFSITITKEQLTSLYSFPVVIESIPAPGVGFSLSLLNCTMQYVKGGSNFTATSSNGISIGYEGTDLNLNPGLLQGASPATSPSGSFVSLMYVSGSTGGDFDFDTDNKRLVVYSQSGDFGIRGPLASITPNASGSGFVVDDTFSIATGTGGTGKVTSVDMSGGITGVLLTSAGHSYLTGELNITATSGSGVDATVNATVSVIDTGTIKIDGYYYIVPTYTS